MAIAATTPAFSPATAPVLSPLVKGVALGLVSVAIWGSYLAMARAGVNAGLKPVDVTFMRYVTAGLILLPVFVRGGVATAAGVGWGRAFLLALLVGPPFILIGVSGYLFAPLAHGAAIQPAALTLGATFFAVWLAGDRLSRGQFLGLIAMLVGIGAIAGPGAFQGDTATLPGDALFVLAGLMWASFGALAKRWGLAPLQATAAVSVVSAAIFAPIYLVFFGIERLAGFPLELLVVQFIVQGVLSGVVAVVAYTMTVRLLGPGKAGLFPALVPGVAVLIGIPVTGEIPSLWQAAGIALAMAGLMVSVFVKK
jgi:drug/metabolite transporter (DMT)-like permease